MNKDMVGFGFVGNGGFPSSLSSNLSPLAPPFTVDRSNSKANMNSLSNFTETPQPYGVPFSSSLHNWQYSHSSPQGTDYISYCGTENDSLRTTSVPSANDYSNLGSKLDNPASVHWAPPNPNTTDPVSDPFSYGGATKQYYSPYVSQAIDDNVSLVGLNEVNYDLLSSSGLVSMVGSSPVDYSQGLSSLEFPSPWGGYWNGMSEGKRGKRTDVTGNFHQGGTDLPGSHTYQDYMKQGVVPVEHLGLEGNPNSTQSKHADGHGREMNAGFLSKEQMYNHLGQNLGFSPTESSKAHIFGTSTTSSHLESTSLEPVTFSSNCHKSYSPYEKGFQLFDSCISDCLSVTKTSVMPVIRPPIVGTKYPVSDAVASKSMDIGDITDLNRKDGSNYNQAVEKEPLLPPSSELGFLDANHLGIHTSRNDQRRFTAASSSKEDMFAESICENSVDHIKVRGGEIPNINVPHGLTLSFESKHTANTTETSDQHNPAEDSPCWKGAPASSASPSFESSETILPQNLMMKLEARDSYGFEMTQMLPQNNESVMGFSGEVGGPNFLIESLSTDNNKLVPPVKNLGAILPDKEHSVANPARLKSDSGQQIRSNRDHNLSNVENQIKQCNLLNMSRSDSGSIQSQTELLCPKEVNFTCKSKIQLQAGDVDARISNSDTSENGCIPLHTVENVLCSPPSEKDDGKPPAMASNPKINVQTLANALHNISELLVLYNSGDEWGLKEECSKTLEHAIHNINLCLSKKILQSPRQELLFPKADISHIAKEGARKARLHAMNEVGNSTVSQLYSYSRHEQKRIHGVSDPKFEKNMDFISSRNEADAAWHENMVQKIKFVFDDNFQSEEVISPDTLLYKNLWLNAEAELCVTGLKARFDQVKIHMENCKSNKTKEDSLVVESIPSSRVPPDTILNNASGLMPNANDSPKQRAPVDCSLSSLRSNAKDVEASVMARFKILKWRDDKVNTCNVEDKSLPHVVQADGTDIGFPCKIVESHTGNKSFDVAVGSRVRHHNDRKSEKNLGLSRDGRQHDAVEESNVYVSDDPTTIQPYIKFRPHNEPDPRSGWYVNTSSDWEQVLKDDFAWQK
ncbi:hypothetical protein POM88_041940 [Heracleum sosnowskyi]|uniref:Uncharacterized protein n=1 Tax=Heracleum sosnowskyi TaxID=360622 RepID=A0AAD8MB82_9APIA|nr:hypothetical protein POM88_041940 [Heracleum sosnowskyi]